MLQVSVNQINKNIKLIETTADYGRKETDIKLATTAVDYTKLL